MTDFVKQNLAGSRFEEVYLTDARFRDVDLRGARFHLVDLSGARIRGAEVSGVEISGEIHDLTVNGVDVAPLVEAELDRRDPDRAKMRPTNADGFREAWDIVERRWSRTVERARAMPPQLLHDRVEDEWSFIETLRHLAFATDCWVGLIVLGDPAPWHALDLPHEEMTEDPRVPRDRTARPSLDEALALRLDRMATVRRLLAELSDEDLDRRTAPVRGPGWSEPESFPVRECLSVVLNEEWNHRLYAERDLDLLEARA